MLNAKTRPRSALAAPLDIVRCVGGIFSNKKSCHFDRGSLSAFISEGYVSLVEHFKGHGSSQSFILEGVLPFDFSSDMGNGLLVQEFGPNIFSVPLHSRVGEQQE